MHKVEVAYCGSPQCHHRASTYSRKGASDPGQGIYVRFLLNISKVQHSFNTTTWVGRNRIKGTHIIPFHVAQFAATILDTAERRFPHKYTGLLPYTFAKGTMRRGPNPEKIIYFV